jgi:hypothetical protein
MFRRLRIKGTVGILLQRLVLFDLRAHFVMKPGAAALAALAA